MITHSECIFCQIIAGEKPAEILYEDPFTLALLDIRQPKIGGHVLVIPREHIENMHALPEALFEPMVRTTKLVTDAVKAAIGCSGINHLIANGKSAGQTVFHLHIHIFPRNSRLGLINYYLRSFLLRRNPGAEELARMAEPIRKKISDMSGK
ncbi:HIT domain-containing protein [candidate division KSB1 bacterium]|nr:HIT domain-containing protein [candidate division KSB1 bacterium]